MRVAPARQRENGGFVNVLDGRKAPAHVAIQRAVAHGVFALVARGQQQMAVLVGQGHEQHAAHARLQVFFRGVGGLAFQQNFPLLEESLQQKWL